MSFSAIQLRRIATYVLLAMLLSAFAPAVSKVLAAGTDADIVVEVCTVEGMKFISLKEAGDLQPTPGDSPKHDDCPYCHLQCAQFLAVSDHSIAVDQPFSIASHYSLHFILQSTPAWMRMPARAPPSQV
jgi:hypothetical protein